MRQRSLLVGLLVVAACSKSGGEATTPRNQVATPAGNTDYTETLADPLGFLPVDSELVLGLDGPQIRASQLFGMFESRLAGSTELANFKQVCGFDPVTSVGKVTMGFKNLGDDTKVEGVMVMGGLDRARLTDCLTRMAAGQKALSVSNGVIRIQGEGTDPSIVFTFVNASTLVAHVGRTATTDTLNRVLASRSPLRGSPAFVAMVGQVDLAAAMWGAMNGSSTVFDQASGMGMRPKAVFGSLRLADGLSANLRVRLESPQQAQSLTTAAQGQMAMAKSFFDKLDVTAQESDLVVVAAMSDQQLTNLVGMLGGMLGGAGSP